MKSIFRFFKRLFNKIKLFMRKVVTVLSGGNPYGEELIINGDFSNGLTNWSSNSGAILSIEPNGLKILAPTLDTSVGARQNSALWVPSLEEGKNYIFSINIKDINADYLEINLSGNEPRVYSEGIYSFEFLQGVTITNLTIKSFSSVIDEHYVIINNVSLKEIL